MFWLEIMDNSTLTPSQIMSKWLAHPQEFGEEPVEISEVFRGETEWWPREKPIEVVFHKYRMRNGYVGIGMTGPITWSFVDNLPWDNFSIEDLKRFYLGWYICAPQMESPEYNPEQNALEKQRLEASLMKADSRVLQVVQYLHVGNLVFFVTRVKEGEEEKFEAFFGAEERLTCPTSFTNNNSYMILYHLVGGLFLEKKI